MINIDSQFDDIIHGKERQLSALTAVRVGLDICTDTICGIRPLGDAVKMASPTCAGDCNLMIGRDLRDPLRPTDYKVKKDRRWFLLFFLPV